MLKNLGSNTLKSTFSIFLLKSAIEKRFGVNWQQGGSTLIYIGTRLNAKGKGKLVGGNNEAKLEFDIPKLHKNWQTVHYIAVK